MPRRSLAPKWLSVVGLACALCGTTAWAQSGEDSRTALEFMKDLRDNSLHDIALDYIKILRADPQIPAEIKDILDYEEGRTLIDEATRSQDLVLREELLRAASEKLEGFVKAHPKAMQARDAQVHIGKLLLQRGHTAMLLTEEAQDPAKKAAKVAEARAAFTQARETYRNAIDPLKEEYKKFAGFIEKDDPRVAARDAIYTTLLDAMLQQGVADYELGETYPKESPERVKAVKDALTQFELIYKNHREQWAGLTARMWQGKCYEEQGEIGAGVAIYKELMGHTEPKLRDLQRHVGYFYIVALGKRKQYALAADECARWLQFYNKRGEVATPAGLGVLTEYSKNLDAQMHEISENERPRARKLIVDSASQVVRYASPYKKDALEMLKKYKPSAALRAEDILRITYEDAVNQANEAIGSQDWAKAIALLKAAVRKADPARSPDKANHARYLLAFCYFKNSQLYEAAVLSEHLARRYPQFSLAPQASEIGMQSLADAYNTYTQIDRLSDLDRLVNLATYMVETWPEKEQADAARMNLGQFYYGTGRYDDSIKALTSVRTRSQQWIPAQNRLGMVHWRKSRVLESRGDAAGAAAESQKAIDSLNAALKARRDVGTGVTDPGYIGNIADLATVLSETGKPAEALAVLDPVIKAQTLKTGPGLSMLMEAQLKAYIVTGNVDAGIKSMQALEQAGGAAGRAQLYFKLGKLLERELENVRAKKNTKALVELNRSFKTFLTTVAEAKTGQTYESLDWAGSSFLSIDAFQDAEKAFRRMLSDYSQDAQFMQQAGSQNRLIVTRIKLASALRGQKKFDEANSLLDEVLSHKPPYSEALIEKGMLLEAEAEAGQGNWNLAINHWEDLTRRMERSRPRPTAYYDAWYHVAYGLSRQKNTAKARQALMGVMRLSPGVGGPEMKAKYQGLLARLK
jgi:cellulose synthase operon protein C